MVVAMVIGTRFADTNAMAGRRATVGAEHRKRGVVAARHGRLTVRGRVAVAVLSALLAWGCFGLVGAHDAQSDLGAMPVTTYTVRPGDTLWVYASSITPEGGDVSETVEQLKALNNLPSSALQTGQRIVVPLA